MTTSQRVGDHTTVIRNGRVAEVVYDRGDGLNALSVKGMQELKDAATSLATDASCQVVVLRGETTFCAGADLKDPEHRRQAERPLLERRTAARLGPDLCQAWADLEQMTIAAVDRYCIGGGLALAVACDHRVASSSARFQLPEVPLGMNMSWRSAPRLVALLGPSRAKEFIILGKAIDAETAMGWGLVDRIAEDGAARDAALAWAEDYAALPPLALRMAKQAVDVCAQPLAHATSVMDRDQFLLTGHTKDQAEAIAAFLEKRPPAFTGD